MKIPSIPTALPRPSALRTLLAAAGLFCLAGLMRAQDANIGVRTYVVDKTSLWSHDKGKIAGEGGHSKLYGILPPAQIDNEQKLIKPVDADALLVLLVHELDANGFTRAKKGQKPDIIITASYGRGQVNNPYIRDQGEISYGDNTLPTVSITGAFAQQLIDEKTPGYEQKLQKAGYEKLFIRVTAFEFPKTKDAKMKMLWKTVIVADDPDHRDLNNIAGAMLAAGAPFFDKESKEPEIDLYKPVQEGHVNVGTPEVVDSDKAKSK